LLIFAKGYNRSCQFLFNLAENMSIAVAMGLQLGQKPNPKFYRRYSVNKVEMLNKTLS